MIEILYTPRRKEDRFGMRGSFNIAGCGDRRGRLAARPGRGLHAGDVAVQSPVAAPGPITGTKDGFLRQGAHG